MLRIDRKARILQALTQRSLPDAGLLERSDLQAMIKASPDAFFAELGEHLLIVGDEIRPDDFVDDRIDLLAIDERGAAVVIELKRGSHKLQLLQAVAYAGMVAKWDKLRFLSERSRLTGKPVEVIEDEVEEFIGGDLAILNQTQRICLLAENFEYEVLVAAEWLNERYSVDVRCSRLSLSSDGTTEFLACTVIFPPPEITEHAVRRGSLRPTTVSRWNSWDEALGELSNGWCYAHQGNL